MPAKALNKGLTGKREGTKGKRETIRTQGNPPDMALNI